MTETMENIGNTLNTIFNGMTPSSANKVSAPVLSDKPQVHMIPWTLDAFPKDGSGKTLKAKVGDVLHFKATDELRHNVAEADLVDGEWLPSQNRKLDLDFKTRTKFDEKITLKHSGTYRFASPVDGQYETMRLTIVVQKPIDKEAEHNLDKTKKEVQQAFDDVNKKEAAARQAVEAARVQKTELSRKKADEMIKVAEEARKKVEEMTNRLRGIAEEMGQDVTQWVNQASSGAKKISFGPINLSNLSNLKILEGTGTFSSMMPNLSDLAKYNIFSPNTVIGPLMPVSKKMPSASPVPSVPSAPGNGKEVNPIRQLKILWNLEAMRHNLPENDPKRYAPRELTIPVGTEILFESDDNLEHNLVESSSEFTPKANPMIDTRSKTRVKFTEKLYFDKVGDYYFLCSKHPNEMRLLVHVRDQNEVDEIIEGA